MISMTAENPSPSVNQTKRAEKKSEKFSEQIEMSKMIYFSLRFVVFHDFLVRAESMKKGWFDVETL